MELKVPKGFDTSEAYKKLADNPKAMQELVNSVGWQILMAWADQMQEGFKDTCVMGENSSERDEARMQFVALKKFCTLPYFLVEVQEKAVEDATSGDSR
jgi:hypothetical protein